LVTATCEEFINTALRRLQRTHLFRCQELSLDIPYSATTQSVPLPPDFLTESGVWSKDPSATDPTKALAPVVRTQRRFWIEAVDPSNLRDTIYPNVASPSANTFLLTSRWYYIWAQQLVIVPQPNALITLTLDYWKKTADLTGVQFNDFTVLYPDLLRAGALVEAYKFLHEDERAATIEAEYQDKLRQSIGIDDTTAFSGPPPVRGK